VKKKQKPKKPSTKQKKRKPRTYIIGEEGEQAILHPSLDTMRRREAFQAGMEAGAKLPKKRIIDDALALELQATLEAHLRLVGKPKKQGIAIRFVEERMIARGLVPPQDDGYKIEREIVRPVYRRLGFGRKRRSN
jgi:hypothetical protein